MSKPARSPVAPDLIDRNWRRLSKMLRWPKRQPSAEEVDWLTGVIKRTAYHESGHLVGAALMGYDCGSVSLRPKRTGDKGIHHMRWHPERVARAIQPTDVLFDTVPPALIVHRAGFVAESLFAGDKCNDEDEFWLGECCECDDEDAGTCDHRQWSRLVAVLDKRAGRNAGRRMAERINRWLPVLMAEPLVWGAVARVAEALLRVGYVSERQAGPMVSPVWGRGCQLKLWRRRFWLPD